MKTLLIVAAAAAALPSVAQAQDWGRYGRDPDRRSYSSQGHGAPSWWDQRDRPGDYRCDAYWDRGRDDCHEAWRDQRRYTSDDGYGVSRGHHYGQAHGQDWRRRGQGGAQTYYGAYGRPDVVYGAGGGHAYASYGQPAYGHQVRDPARVEWCRWTYRSYDPGSGYYRAYSGRLIYCG